MHRKPSLSKLLSILAFCLSVLVFASYKESHPTKLIIFQGSDWCKQCINFEENILNDSFVIEKINKWHIEIEKIDFPQRKKLSKEQKAYNNKIAEQYHFDGTFPTIIMTKNNSSDFNKITYAPKDSPHDFLKKIELFLVNSNSK